MGIGLGVGLLVAVLVYVKDHHGGPAEPVSPKKSATHDAEPGGKGKPEIAEEAPAAQYEFYDRLPKFEVVVPEKGQVTRAVQPTTKIDEPGTYVLQAGSFRQVDDAERARAKLAKLGIAAAVQRVSIDDDVWHRIRIGPINNLDQLHRADIDPIVTRVGD
jgi:cell division protein FtsN